MMATPTQKSRTWVGGVHLKATGEKVASVQTRHPELRGAEEDMICLALLSIGMPEVAPADLEVRTLHEQTPVYPFEEGRDWQ